MQKFSKTMEEVHEANSRLPERLQSSKEELDAAIVAAAQTMFDCVAGGFRKATGDRLKEEIEDIRSAIGASSEYEGKNEMLRLAELLKVFFEVVMVP